MRFHRFYRGQRPRPVPAAMPARRSFRGFALLEALVYIGLVVMLLGIGYVALYRCIDNSVALRRSVDDIANALRLGERWRADLRAARGEVRIENGPGEQTLYLPGPRGVNAYRFAEGALFRRLGEGQWIRLLGDIKTSTMSAEKRGDVFAWRWELELEPRSKATVKASRIRPLFTFLAVPEPGPAPALRAAAAPVPSPGGLADAADAGLVDHH